MIVVQATAAFGWFFRRCKAATPRRQQILKVSWQVRAWRVKRRVLHLGAVVVVPLAAGCLAELLGFNIHPMGRKEIGRGDKAYRRQHVAETRGEVRGLFVHGADRKLALFGYPNQADTFG